MFTTFDWICLGIGIVGCLLVVLLLYLNDWDIEKTMFKDYIKKPSYEDFLEREVTITYGGKVVGKCKVKDFKG